MEQDMKKKKKAVFAANGVGTMAANGVEPQDAGADVIPDGTAQRNQASLKPGGGTGNSSQNAMAEGVEFDVSDFANALFEGEELSDSFKQKCIAIFEAAVNEKVAVMEEAMIEASKKIIAEQVEQSVQTITEGVDKYLTYVCEEWMNENKLAVESGMKTEIVENFIYGLRELFENSFIDVPEEKYNVVDELFEANGELESKLNEQINENISLKNQLIAHQCADVFVEAAKGLADTEVEKFASLAEGIEFDSVEQYKEKINVLRESYFGEGVKTPSDDIVSPVSENTTQPVSTGSEMDTYVRLISEQLKLTNNKKVL
jgi:hypothetical protein